MKLRENKNSLLLVVGDCVGLDRALESIEPAVVALPQGAEFEAIESAGVQTFRFFSHEEFLYQGEIDSLVQAHACKDICFYHVEHIPGPRKVFQLRRIGVNKFWRYQQDRLIPLRTITLIRKAVLNRVSALWKWAWRLIDFVSQLDMLPKTSRAYLWRLQSVARSQARVKARTNSDSVGHKLSVVQFIGALHPGGAERQLCNLAKGLVGLGHEVSVVCLTEAMGHKGFYKRHLESFGVRIRHVGDMPSSSLNGCLASAGSKQRYLLEHTHIYIKESVERLWCFLIENRPDVLHCWLDFPNLVGGFSGLLAGVPRIILSTRNVSPVHFPYLYAPPQKQLYQILLAFKQVTMINNSDVGARDYSKWLGIDYASVPVVRNCLDPEFDSPRESHADPKVREQFGIPPEAPLIVGVFRLSPEKRPLDFVRVVALVKKKMPQVHAVIMGQGNMDTTIRKAIKKQGLDQGVKLIGVRSDVAEVIKAGQLMLQCSQWEGTPNSLMEAQFLGLPVVATSSGGTPEAVIHGKTGLLHKVGDIQGMAASVRMLLENPIMARDMGREGRMFVGAHYSVQNAVNQSLAAYEMNWPKPADTIPRNA